MKKRTTKKRALRQPQMRTHKQSKQCFVRLSGQVFWCGPESAPETSIEFHHQVAAWEACGRKPETSA